MGPPPIKDIMEEEVMLQVLNKLDNINVISEDIEVCHSIPGRRDFFQIQ